MTQRRVRRLAILSTSLTAILLATGCGQSDSTKDTETADVAPAADSAEVSQIAENPTRNAYFGDLHIHTKNSFDAFIFGTRVGPDDAYKFAKGEAIPHAGGGEMQLQGPPLDFLAVTDHGEYLGIVPRMADPRTDIGQTETALAVFGPEAEDPRGSFLRVGLTIVSGEEIDEIYDRDEIDSVWASTVAAADRHNQPGTFTAFSGYEFTAMRAIPTEGAQRAANLHRNVIFRDGAPERLFSTLDSTNPEDLWSWMDERRAEGLDVLAIPHNSNASNGEMFAAETYLGDALSADWSSLRMRNEPLMEISQLKGTSEVHPSLSPNDEFAGFEQYEYFIGSQIKATVNVGDFARTALGRGLELNAAEGFNPYTFGFIGSSDTHLGAASLREDNHWGKFGTDGASPEARQSVPPNGATEWPAPQENTELLAGSQYSASGLAGVWAEANTRGHIFDAMARKETFGTSGPRMRVRLFGGFDYSEEMLSAPDLLEQAYAGGVPMGGDLQAEPDTGAPSFIAWAMQDAISAPLQRMQIIKVWTANGQANERVYDIACSGGAEPDAATRRCPDNGARVDPSTCVTEPGSGAAELKTLWTDPDFDAGQEAVYYVRALENPTCRWSSWDALRNGTPPNPELTEILQERVWSSPVFYKVEE
ncbi:MAG: DUF3604 domain-containing protein [Hyphomonadaceae bacterium]